MSPRPLRLRKISKPPVISGFKPYGSKKNPGKEDCVFLHLEEYEAIRLCDYEMLNHFQASVLMAVSRPTLTRIYSKARQKIATALVLGKQIIIEGGKIYFDSEWYSCKACGCYFNNPDKQVEMQECPLCRSTNFMNYEPNNKEPEESLAGSTDIYICQSCGFTKSHLIGYPVKDEICPSCGRNMVTKIASHIKSY